MIVIAVLFENRKVKTVNIEAAANADMTARLRQIDTFCSKCCFTFVSKFFKRYTLFIYYIIGMQASNTQGMWAELHRIHPLLTVNEAHTPQ